MILDRLTNAETYYNVHPLFRQAFEAIKGLDLAKSKEKKIIVSDKIYINIDNPTLRPMAEAFPEAHDKYIDIQIPLIGEETVGVMPREDCHIILRRDAEKDYVIYKEMPEQFFKLTNKDFAVFFPCDAHSPIIGEGTEKKIVIKVAVD